MRPDARTRERLLAKVSTLSWVHRIDLGDGEVTPGTWGNHNPDLFRALDSIDFRGKKVLDIGCWDGLFSFEAEKRGAAEVYATDLVTQRRWDDQPTLLLAKEILGSRVKYFPNMPVQAIETLGVDDFDVVIYAGVFYHVRDPLLTFTTLRRVMKEGATILVEGAAIDSPECSAQFYYREPYLGDYSNWWVPTTACLRQWVESSFFAEDRAFGVWDGGGVNPRFTLTARAVRRADPHYIRPDDGLAPFDLNTYPRVFSDPPMPKPEAPAPLAIRVGRRVFAHAPMSALAGPNTPMRARLKRWAKRIVGA